MAILGEIVIAGRTSPPNLLRLLADPMIWALIGFGAGVYFFFRGFVSLRRKRFIQSIPRSTIRAAALGLVEVSGEVKGPYTIVAPLSEQDCFFYHAIARQEGNRTPVEETLSAPFFLDDGTGKLLVDGRSAKTDLPPSFSENYSSHVPDYLHHFLSRHGIPSGFPVQLEEFCIRPGDKLFVMGTLRENTPTDAGTYAENFLSAEAADLQRRGEMEAEMPAAIAKTSTRVPSTTKASAECDLHPPVILAGQTPREPLFISIRSQREVLRALAWQATLFIWGGPILTLACFWYLLERLGYF
jgi:hypothetical protein